MVKTIIVGVDCATEAKKIGLAKGLFSNGQLQIVDAGCGGSRERLLSLLADWIRTESRVLLALDALLGWPIALGKSLVTHTAGTPLSGTAESLFRRETDRLVTEHCRKRPLDVGADRIARTAHAALKLLGELAEIIAQAIPLAWETDFSSAWLQSRFTPQQPSWGSGIRCSQYKKPEHVHVRRDMISKLSEHIDISIDSSVLVHDANVLDAVICGLAGADFLRGDALHPFNPTLAKNEGWIWAKMPAL
jgi:hypothetical protein